MKVLCVVGARPNFMKVAPVQRALEQRGIAAPLLHTGQHYDKQMSQVFFDELGMPKPHINLGVGSGSHAQQTARIMAGFEPVLQREAPDMVLVAGDVNSTVACALVAAQCHVPIAHLEAGLRSFQRAMPEEINRVVTDQLSDLLLTPSADADANLQREGIALARIKRVGNAMIDSLLTHVELARERGRVLLARLGVGAKAYGLVTLHRPVNVDGKSSRHNLVEILRDASKRLPLLFPMHPRSRASFGDEAMADLQAADGVHLMEPLGYLDFVGLQAEARIIMTDSGGVQEESTALGVPCLTLREETERPVTVEQGTNTIVGCDPRRVLHEVHTVLESGGKSGRVPPLWDGRTAGRVVDAIVAHLGFGAAL